MTDLEQWLIWIDQQHPITMDLQLDRIKRVATQVGLQSFSVPVITVAGTNGKGSCVAMLQSILTAAGYRTGTYMSPHLLSFNERIRIDLKCITDQALIDLFTRIAEASQKTCSLTYFEYATLAALLYFQQADLDVIVLEVGLGGRLDAVNIVDPSLSIITSIALDHMQWLGHDRNTIAREKAGIMRADTPVVCGEPDVTPSILQQASSLNAPLYLQNRDFFYTQMSDCWHWQSQKIAYKTLPLPSFALQNAATVLMALTCLEQQLPVAESAIHQGFTNAALPGRCQYIPGDVCHYIDVAHNPAASVYLAERLQAKSVKGRTYAVISMLADKNIAGTLAPLQPCVDEWYTSEIISSPRAAKIDIIKQAAQVAGITSINTEKTLSMAYQRAYANALPGDRVIIVGSFHTVSELLPLVPANKMTT